MSEPSFNGSADQQALAAEIFRLMTMQGTLFAADSPIRQTLANLADFFAVQRQRDRETVVQEIDIALKANAQIFAREEHEGDVIYITSRQGAYAPRQEDISHNFRQRLHDPDQPLPVDDISVVVSTSRPALTTVEPVFISDYWQIQAGLSPVETATLQPTPEDMTVEHVKAPADLSIGQEDIREPTTVVEPVTEIASTEEPPAAVEEALEAMAEALLDTGAATPKTAPIAPEVVEEVEIVEAALVDAQIPAAELTAAEAISESIPEAEPAPIPTTETASVIEIPVEPEIDFAQTVEAPPAEPIEAKPAPIQIPAGEITFELPDGTEIDLAQPVEALLDEHGAVLEQILLDRLEKDPLRRIVSFGRDLYPEGGLINLGKNDLRRIRDYIVERNEPLLDTEIIADLYYHNPRHGDYEGFRFSLNYRLHREKDFEFVGVEGARLWSAKGLPPIGTKRVKAGEMGQLAGYLVEGYDDSPETQDIVAIRENGSVTRFLSFFEWQTGILPLDAGLAALIPAPMLAEQRSAVLRFESPQHYTSFLAEARYPTGSRGGWLQGLDEFFLEHLVAGALVTIARTDQPNIFTISYDETEGVEDRLLVLDEKKNKLAFANITYYCMADEDLVPSQRKYGRLKNLKSLPMSERRKAEMILEHVFSAMGKQTGTRSAPSYWLSLDELMMGYNVLRPASRSYLLSLIEATPEFQPDESTPAAYFYTPEPTEEEGEGEEDEDEADRFIGYGKYDDYDE